MANAAHPRLPCPRVAELREHLRSADPALLLLSLVHVTGDTSLPDRYADRIESPPPTLSGRSITPVMVTSEEVHAEITEQHPDERITWRTLDRPS